MRMLLGTELKPEDRMYVLAAYVHRNVHRQRTDEEWLANTRFYVRKDGSLDGRFHRCETTYPEQYPAQRVGR